MNVVVTGGGGFVGRNLMDALGDARSIELGEPLDFAGADAVVHLAANADVRDGWSKPTRDLEHNTVFTSTVLEAMRVQGVKRLLFASSNAVYGNAPIPTPETYAGHPTSLYGASKLAGEALISAYATAGHVSATVLRLTPMLGWYYRHGLIADFVEKLLKEPRLEVLGGGGVARTRMDVRDGVGAFLHRLPEDPGFEVFNVGRPDTVTSLEVAHIVAEILDVDADITVVGESWVGDDPILLDCEKLRAIGWEPHYTIHEGIERTVEWLTR